MDESYLDDYETGKIHFRDKWQFELKSELYPFSDHRKDNFVQEFYFFIPNSLQITEQTYSKAQFYQDQTNLIRLKTPRFTFSELADPLNRESPLVKIRELLTQPENADNVHLLQNELKLFGSIFHSSIRNWFFAVQTDLEKGDEKGLFVRVEQSLKEQEQLFSQYRILLVRVSKLPLEKNVGPYFGYIDEFISLTYNDYLLNILKALRQKPKKNLEALDPRICDCVLKEKKYRREHYLHNNGEVSEFEDQEEFLLYRKGLLNKFVIDPLLLKTSRSPAAQRYRSLIGGIPAAIAMLIFLVLYVWGGSWFIINSMPFILITVILYVLKDRLKEDLRSYSYRLVALLFSDYTTEIEGSSNGSFLGLLREYMSFIDEEKIPNDIKEIRNREFHKVLEEFKRPEQIIYYKKSVSIQRKPKTIEERFYGLNIFFRFDIHHFLAKAEDPFQDHLILDDSLQIKKVQLPRVYHVNIIMKSRKYLPDGSPREELIKYRLILDKSGIKRIEEVKDPPMAGREG